MARGAKRWRGAVGMARAHGVERDAHQRPTQARPTAAREKLDRNDAGGWWQFDLQDCLVVQDEAREI